MRPKTGRKLQRAVGNRVNSHHWLRAKAQKKGEVREDRRAPPAAPGEALVAAQPPDVDAYRLIRGL